MPIFRNPQTDPSQQQPDAAAVPAVDPATTGSIRPQRTAAPPSTVAPPRGGLLGSMFGGGNNYGYDDDPRSRISKIGAMLMMMDPMTERAGSTMMQIQQNRAATNYALKRQNQTAQWLTTQGLGEQEASFLASDPNALNEWYKQWNDKKYPKWELHELYNAQHQKVQVMMDMRTGHFSQIGDTPPPNMEYDDSYDANGKKIKILRNKDDPLQEPIQIGGAETDVLSPQAQQQKVEVAKAGVVPQYEKAYDVETGGEHGFGGQFNAILNKGGEAETSLGRLDLMEKIAQRPDFHPGGDEGVLRAKQWGEFLGFKQEDTATMELFNQQSKALAFDMMGGKLGAGFSDADRDFIRNLLPTLANSKAGILTMIQVQKALAQRATEIRNRALEYTDDPSHPRLDAGFIRETKQWAHDNPIFGKNIQDLLTTQSAQPDPPGEPRVGGGRGGGGQGGGGSAPPGGGGQGGVVTMQDGSTVEQVP